MDPSDPVFIWPGRITAKQITSDPKDRPLALTNDSIGFESWRTNAYPAALACHWVFGRKPRTYCPGRAHTS